MPVFASAAYLKRWPGLGLDLLPREGNLPARAAYLCGRLDRRALLRRAGRRLVPVGRAQRRRRRSFGGFFRAFGTGRRGSRRFGFRKFLRSRDGYRLAAEAAAVALETEDDYA